MIVIKKKIKFDWLRTKLNVTKFTEQQLINVVKFVKRVAAGAETLEEKAMREATLQLITRKTVREEIHLDLAQKASNRELFRLVFDTGFKVAAGIGGSVKLGMEVSDYLIKVEVLEIKDFKGWKAYLISAPKNPLPILEIPRNLPSDSPETPILLIKDKEYTPWEQLVRFLGGMKVKEVPEDEPVVPVSKVEKVVIPKTSDNSITDID